MHILCNEISKGEALLPHHMPINYIQTVYKVYYFIAGTVSQPTGAPCERFNGRQECCEIKTSNQ